MIYVLFGKAHLTPAEMVAAAVANENGFTTNSGLFTGAPWAPTGVAAQRLIVTGKIDEEANVRLALKQVIKEKNTESGKLGDMLAANANFTDTKAIADPANGAAIANKGGYQAKEGANHTEDTPPATEHFSVANGVHIGESNLHCDAILGYGGITYKYYYSLNVTVFAWVLGDAGGNSMTLHGQPTGVPIAYKVVGSNVNGDGADSAIIIKTLPTA